MTHDEFHNLKVAYLAGGLGDAERGAVESHAASCPACAANAARSPPVSPPAR